MDDIRRDSKGERSPRLCQFCESDRLAEEADLRSPAKGEEGREGGLKGGRCGNGKLLDALEDLLAVRPLNTDTGTLSGLADVGM
jgi:hypothetical protein